MLANAIESIRKYLSTVQRDNSFPLLINGGLVVMIPSASVCSLI